MTTPSLKSQADRSPGRIDKSTGLSIGIILILIVAVVTVWDRFGRVEQHSAVIEQRFLSLESSVVNGFREVKRELEKQRAYWSSSALAVVRVETKLEALEARVRKLESTK